MGRKREEIGGKGLEQMQRFEEREITEGRRRLYIRRARHAQRE